MSFGARMRSGAVRYGRKALPFAVQSVVVGVGARMIQRGWAGSSISIQYRSYTVFLNRRDFGGAEIYFFYLLHGHWKHERYEQTVVENVLGTSTGWVFVDVGASYGMYSLLAASKPNVRNVIAAEASRDTCATLGRTIVFNQLQERIDLRHTAVSSVSGSKFRIVELRSSEWNKVAPAQEADKESILSISVDDMLEAAAVGDETPVFVKMDIEGHEPTAFLGMESLLHQRKEFAVLFEFHVGLLQDAAYAFADQVFAVPHSSLYLVDSQVQRLERLTPSSLRARVDPARTAKHPFNLFNLLLVSNSVAAKLPAGRR